MKKILFVLAIAVLSCLLCVGVAAEETAPENYVVNENEYIIYNTTHYQEVLTGIKDGTLENKTVVLGCDIEAKFDFVMDCAVDVTIDLNNHTLANTYVSNKSGDFDLQHEDAIIRVKNGKMTSSFCMFIFRNYGQVYAENVDIVSREECVYQYGGYSGVLSFKNCTIDITYNYSSISLGSCGGKGGTLYQIEGCRLDGLNIHCARPGSYVKDCVVYDRQLHIDCWHGHGENNADVSVSFTNVDSQASTKLNDARIDPVFYDSTLGEFVDLTGGNQLLVSYTSASCTQAGAKVSYIGGDTGTPDEQYALDNPALGHSLDLESIKDIEYISYDEKGYYVADCTRCGESDVKESEPSAKALIVCQGFSVPEFGEVSIALSFIADYDAIDQYETITGYKVELGMVVAAASNLGENTLLDENGNATVLQSGNVIKSKLKIKNSYIDLKVSGLTSEHMGKELIMGSYILVTDQDTVKSINYVQNEKAEDGRLYSTVTYNSLVGAE